MRIETVLVTGTVFAASIGVPMIQPQVAGATPPDAACYNSPSNHNCDGASPSECWGGAYADYYHELANYWTDWYPFETTLWYSPKCGTNWAEETVGVYGESNYIGAKVRRAAGPDGPYLMERTGVQYAYDLVSRMVWAPHNAAQACLETLDSDQLYCTPWF